MKNLKRVGVQHSKSVVEGRCVWMFKHNFPSSENFGNLSISE